MSSATLPDTDTDTVTNADSAAKTELETAKRVS